MPINEETRETSVSASCRGYKVEARFNSHYAEAVGDQIFDQRWQAVQFSVGTFGVPQGRFASNVLGEMHLLSYEQAEALRWWFLARLAADKLGGTLCFETRLVEYEVKYSRSAKPLEYINAFDSRGSIPQDAGIHPAHPHNPADGPDHTPEGE